MSLRRAAALLLPLLLTLAPGARAQEAAASPVVAKPRLPPEPPKDPAELAFDLGLVSTGGNTSVTTLNVGERVTLNQARWQVAQAFAHIYGRNDGTTNANLWRASLRGDWFATGNVGFFAGFNYERNPFAGISGRFEEGAGLAARVGRESRQRLVVETGLAAVQQRSTADSLDAFVTGRAALTWRLALAEKAYVQQFVEALPNLKEADDLRLNTESALVAPVVRHLAVKLSYVVRFDNVPQPGFRKTDRVFTSGVQLVF